MIKHLGLFSGGAMSWASCKLAAQKHGTDGMVLLFADTMMEDEDLYRFLDEAVANIGAPLVRIADGRTPWEVMRDHNCIAKPRMDMCSRELKRDILDKWRKENTRAEECTVHFGMGWDEMHRLTRIREILAPWKCESYAATERPILTKPKILEWMKAEGLRQPRLYNMGFPHNNCGGFCIKAGQAHFAHLLRMMPERYAFHEAKEEEMRERVGDYSVLRDRTGGTTKTLTLRTLRERIERNESFDLFDWGGCGCATGA